MQPGDMTPACDRQAAIIFAPGGRYAAKKVLQHGMTPILDLQDIGDLGECLNVARRPGNGYLGARRHDLVDIAPIDRLLEQQEGLLDIGRHVRRHRRVRLADAAAKMDGEMEDFHRVAAVPPPVLIPCPLLPVGEG